MKRRPTHAGAALTAQGSGEIVAGLLRAMRWENAGRAGAKVTILAPSPEARQAVSAERRVMIQGWVVHLQMRSTRRQWSTVAKLGALQVLRSIAATGEPDAIFFEHVSNGERVTQCE